MASRPTRQRLDLAKVAHLCASGKASHDTYGEALDAAEDMMRAGRVEPGCHQTPYFHEACGRWHLYNRVIVRVDRGDPARRFKGRPEA